LPRAEGTQNPSACLYFVGDGRVAGAQLEGNIERGERGDSMQRELILDTDKPLAEALARALETMIEEARVQSRRAVEAPAAAMHDYRRALRRAESVLELAWPFLRKLPREWLAKSFARARRRTRIARDLDAVLPVVDKLRDLDLVAASDPTMAAVRTWLEACRSELASDEIVAWRLRKNVRSLAGSAEIFASAIHAWVDIEIALESLRRTYRDARRAYKKADASRKKQDVHGFRKAVRRLRYQLELFASTKAPEFAIATYADEGRSVDRASEPAWVDSVRDMHRTMKSLVREVGEVTDLYALRAIVDEAEADEAGFDPERLSAILGELAEGRLERVMGDAGRAFEASPKRIFVNDTEAPEDMPEGDAAGAAKREKLAAASD